MSDSTHDEGVPEPQIGPSAHITQEVNTRGAGDGGGVSADDDEEEEENNDVANMSADSLDQRMSRPTSPPPNSHESNGGNSSRRSSRRSSRSSGQQRVLYQPMVPADQDRESHVLTPSSGQLNPEFEMTHLNPLAPLVSAGQREAGWVDAVIETMMPQLKEKLKQEFERDQLQAEAEHERRFKEMHETHQAEQFELYEKNVALYDKIALLERRIKSMSQAGTRMQLRMERLAEANMMQRVLTKWRQATKERVETKKMTKISDMIYKRILARRYFNQWAQAVKAKWRGKVEKVCKERATEICLKLKDELTSEINQLKCEVDNRDEIIGEMEGKQQRYEEGLSKALMRGVCALNMEAMSVLNNPDFNVDEQLAAPPQQQQQASTEPNEPIKSKHRAPLLVPQNSHSNIMTASSGRPQSANPYYQLSRPASNVFIDTVNSLEDIAQKKKVKSRSGLTERPLSSTLGPTRSENTRSVVRVERHQGAKKITTQTLPAKPEGKKPWIPASVKILNCENQKLRKEKQKFSAVKHVG